MKKEEETRMNATIVKFIVCVSTGNTQMSSFSLPPAMPTRISMDSCVRNLVGRKCHSWRRRLSYNLTLGRRGHSEQRWIANEPSWTTRSIEPIVSISSQRNRFPTRSITCHSNSFIWKTWNIKFINSIWGPIITSVAIYWRWYQQ